MVQHEEHAHEHKIIDVVDTHSILVYEQAPHDLLTLRLHDRGISIDLTLEEAMGLSDAMQRVAEYLRGRV